MAMVFCRGCGKEIHESAPICPHCGAPNAVVTAPGSVGMPDGVRGWSWGAFFLNWIWAIGNKTWIGLLCLVPLVGFVMAFVLGFKGREWAWKNARWDSLEHFNRVQRLWSIWALILTLGVGGIGVLAAIALPVYQDYTTRAKSSEVLLSMSGVKVALTERIQTVPTGGLLTAKEIQDIKGSAGSSKYVNGVDFYAMAGYADVISTVSINSAEGHIYLYTRDAGGSWVCGSTDYPVKYLPASCRDTGGVDRPAPPVVQAKPNFGLWTYEYAVAVNNGCVDSASKTNPAGASAFCECMTNQLAEVIPQTVMQESSRSTETESAIGQAREICVQKLAAAQ